MSALLTVLCIGDIIGQPGRLALRAGLQSIQEEHRVDFSIANIENATNGFGLSTEVYQELNALNLDAFTSGNHAFSKRKDIALYEQSPKLTRPLNFPKRVIGTGIRYLPCKDHTIAVVNLIGRVFMRPVDCPFQAIESELAAIRKQTPIIFVDLHAEATSEAQAMAWFLSKHVSCVYGTHTHVQTADDRILDGHTAAISDIGMCGSERSILGMEKEPIINEFLSQVSSRKEPARCLPYMINGILVSVDAKTGKASRISRVNKRIDNIKDAT